MTQWPFAEYMLLSVPLKMSRVAVAMGDEMGADEGADGGRGWGGRGELKGVGCGET